METKLYDLLSEHGMKHVDIIKLNENVPNEKSSLKLKNIDEKSFD